MNITAVRLAPGQDLEAELKEFTIERNIQAGFILTTVGSLSQVRLRFADQNRCHSLTGRFEIVSLVGTLSVHGTHLHISVADREGRTIGGHLEHGSIIHTTAEVVIGESPNMVFSREVDQATGHRELEISASR